MSEMEDKLGNILNNPQMMQQIMSMAQSMSAPEGNNHDAPPRTENNAASEPVFPEIDIQTLQKNNRVCPKKQHRQAGAGTAAGIECLPQQRADWKT